MRMRPMASIEVCNRSYTLFPLSVLASLIAVGLTLPAVAIAKPRITTQQVLDEAKAAPGARAVAARVLGQTKKAVGTFDFVGDAPEGFGKQVFTWNRADRQLNLVVFINPADLTGIALRNLKSGDVLRIESATGEATFAEGHGEVIGGLIGVLGAGLKLKFPGGEPSDR